MELITCTNCNEIKPKIKFPPKERRCRKCAAIHTKEWVAKNHERRKQYQLNSYKTRTPEQTKRAYFYSRKAYLKRKYGISQKDYETLVEKQNGVCGICKNPPTKSIYEQLVIDHDHKTGIIRGLLCNNCNVALGNLGDSIDGLERAIRYLKGEIGD